MQVYSLTLNKTDYVYSIKYHQNNDDMQLDTNDEAQTSFKLALGTVKEALREYLVISEDFDIAITTVKFGEVEKDCTVSAICKSNKPDIYPKVYSSVSTKIMKVHKREKDVNGARARILLAVEDLEEEVEKYLNGERAQENLNFEEKETAVTEEAENDDTVFLFSDD